MFVNKMTRTSFGEVASPSSQTAARIAMLAYTTAWNRPSITVFLELDNPSPNERLPNEDAAPYDFWMNQGCNQWNSLCLSTFLL